MSADSPRSLLLIQRSVPPDHSASGRLALELAEYFAKNGWRTTLLACRTPPDAPKEEESGKLTIRRTPCLPFTRRSLWRRALATASIPPFLFAAACRGGKHDLIITLSDPPLLACLGMILSFFWNRPHIHWSQDLYPEVAENGGVLRKGGILAGLLRTASTAALRRCSAVIVPGRCMAKRMCADRGIPREKIHVIPNWAHVVDEDAVLARTHSLRKEWNPGNKFVVMYSGNFGVAHDFTSILDAAVILEKRDADIMFLLSGSGPREMEIRKELEHRNVHNVVMAPPIAQEDLDAWLRVGDVHVVTLQREMEGLVVPSKVYAVMCAGRSTLFVGPETSESALILRETGAGKSVPDGSALANEIHLLKNNRKTIADMSHAAHNAAKGFTLANAGKEFLSHLSHV